ncbi:MAG: 4Fe-4S dicluster domain-containing protein [Bacillota bacterium]
MIKQLGFVFHGDRCIGCRSCELACRNEHYAQGGPQFRRITELKDGSFLSFSCNHCDSPECFRVCHNKAFTKRKDGIVQINPHLCDGCRECIKACPYGAPQYDLYKNKVDKCDLCLPRLQKGLLPACVTACHTGALEFADLDQIKVAGLQKQIKGFPDIRLTRPSIRFTPVSTRKRYWQK